jgi:hypothetical protein
MASKLAPNSVTSDQTTEPFVGGRSEKVQIITTGSEATSPTPR